MAGLSSLASKRLREIVKKIDDYEGTTVKDVRAQLEEAVDEDLSGLVHIIKQQIFDIVKDKFSGDGEESSEEEEVKPKTTAKKRKRKSSVSSVTTTKQKTMTLYQLDEPLAAVCGKDKSPRPWVLKLIWAYIRDEENEIKREGTAIHCDEKLKALFEKDVISNADIMGGISPHMVKLEETITVEVEVKQPKAKAPRKTKAAAPPKKKRKLRKAVEPDPVKYYDDDDEDAMDLDQSPPKPRIKVKRDPEDENGEPLYLLSKRLKKFINKDRATREEVHSKIQDHLKEEGLWDEDKKVATISEKLNKDLFHMSGEVTFERLDKLVSKHMKLKK